MHVLPVWQRWARQKLAAETGDAGFKSGVMVSRIKSRPAVYSPDGPSANGGLPVIEREQSSAGRLIYWGSIFRDWKPFVDVRAGASHLTDSDELISDGEAQNEVPRIELEFSFPAINREMLSIVLRNTLLILMTVTLYRFWARTRVRSYLWSRIVIAGEPLEYSGRAIELLLGFAFILLILIVPLVLVSISMQLLILPDDPLFILYALALYLGVFFLYGVARYRAQRYRLSRTLWRGIRFGLGGSWISFGLRTLGLSYLTFFSVFLAYPAERFILMRQLLGNMTFGDRQFSFKGHVSELYPSFIIAWILSALGLFVTFTIVSTGIIAIVQSGDLPVTIDRDQLEAGVVQPELFLVIVLATVLFYALVGLILSVTMAWYRAKEIRYFAQCITLDGVRFSLNASGFAIMRLSVGNALLILFSLGFALPFAQMRTFRFLFSRLKGEGQLDIDSIKAGDAPYPWIGEGLAEFFEIGAV